MEGLRSRWGDNRTELLRLLSLSLPSSATYLLNRLVGFISVLFVGHLGPDQLAAAALGASLTTVVGFGILSGLTGGMPTLCGQVNGPHLSCADQCASASSDLQKSAGRLFLGLNKSAQSANVSNATATTGNSVQHAAHLALRKHACKWFLAGHCSKVPALRL